MTYNMSENGIFLPPIGYKSFEAQKTHDEAMADFFVRCSSLHKVMGDAKSPNSENMGLTAGAITHLQEIARKVLFDYDPDFSSRMTEKGNRLENDAIYHSAFIRDNPYWYEKETTPVQMGCLRGTCDIWDKPNSMIIDTKCSYTIQSHPFFENELNDKVKTSGYDWQLLAYMMLYGADKGAVDFWLFPTPEELVPYNEDPYFHIEAVNHIPIEHRYNSWRVERGSEQVEKMLAKIPLKLTACENYFAKIITPYVRK